MKRILTSILGLATLLGAASLAFSSCVEDPFFSSGQEGSYHNSRKDPDGGSQGKDDDKDDDKDDGTESNFPGSDKYETRVKARYFGDKYAQYNKNVDDYVLYLYFGEYDEDGNFVDAGTEAAFDMLCPVTEGMKISAGSYTCTSTDVSPYHFLDGAEEDGYMYPSFFYRQYSTTNASTDLITDGTVKVSGGGDNYSIEATFKAGSNTYKWTYTGSIEFIDETSGGDIPSEVTIDRFSRATVENLGSIWNDNSTGKAIAVDDWVVYLYGENYNTDKEYVMIELLSAQGAKSLPAGKYTEFVNDVNTAAVSDFKAGRIIGGYADQSSNTAYGTWYCKGGTAYYAALTGKLSIEAGESGVYTLDFSFTDTDETYGGSFSGCYRGKLETVSTSDGTSFKPLRATAPTFRSALATRSQSAVTRLQAGSSRPIRNAAAARSVESAR